MATIHRKGQGACYAGEIRVLSRLHKDVMEALFQMGARGPEFGIAKRELSRYLAKEMDMPKSGNSISGRLSELLGLKLVGVARVRLRVPKPLTHEFRYRLTPIWFLTEAGMQEIYSGGTTVRPPQRAVAVKIGVI